MLIANILQPLIDACEAILKFWHDVLGEFDGSWGWSIILLTFTVRIAILPLTFKGVKSMNELQRLQPELKRLQERYKDDRQRMNQEVMKFYQEHKVNPLGSCLPLLLQLPFFIALFSLLRSSGFKDDISGNESWLFIPDLADKLTDHPAVLAVMMVLYVATQLAATSVTAMSADPTQRRIMFALPFVFVLFIINFPAGLVLYWVTTNIWTIGQQLLVRKLYPKPPPLEPKADGPGPARGKPPAARDGGPKDKPSGDGAGKRPKEKAAAAAGGSSTPGSKPPPSPRKKKKRSGRRR